MVLRYFFSFHIIVVFLFSCESKSIESLDKEINVKSDEPMTVEMVRPIYILNCASCHGADGKLMASNAADLSKSKMIPESIKSSILNGNSKGMMAYRDVFSEKEIDGLVDFVQTLRK